MLIYFMIILFVIVMDLIFCGNEKILVGVEKKYGI